MKKLYVTMLALCCTVSLAGCSGSAKPADTPAVSETKPNDAIPELSKDPVTVKIMASGGMFSDDEVQKYIVEPVKKKYPQITIERINASASKLPELISAGEIPDIVANYPGPMGSNLAEYKLIYNMEPLMKKYRFDTSRFAPEALETLKIAGGQDYLAGLPAYTNSFALFYNKDVFDKFGIPYPKEGMYWDEVAELAKQLTRTDNGVAYRGIFPDGIGRIQQQLSIPFADFNTNKSLLANDSWKEAFTIWGSLFKIPGLTEGDFAVPNAGKNQTAFASGTLAMIASHSNLLNTLKTSPINWDMVTYPQHRKAPGIGQRLDSPILSISEQSKVKDAAFLVLDTILSDEVQKEMMRGGRLTVLKDEKLRAEFGKGLKEFEGKNLAAMTKLKFAVMTPFKYLPDGEVDKVLSKAFNAYIIDQTDMNTALRTADEEMNKLIQDKLRK
ncbi:ABC transporter substrate-binding protein [Paenibacillus sp. NPDC056579]|uniref:ABC transporter substrate-binding protein n=1 Tax=unclassified Paenibacillus TaxID=185978 RepID=UPI001EF99A40|nr:extracellular solute-binding protein [Paenibacillus sp. H1-7]ULL14672.1 extracellular solute-binding protein [Paenibacillus sp. H1-7]